MRDDKYINELFVLAKSIPAVFKTRFVSALVYRNSIISYGFNQTKTHPLQKRFGKNQEAIYLHSEIDCIKNALKHYKIEVLMNSTLYIARAKYKDQFSSEFIQGLAKPCKGCVRAVVSFDIPRVVYTIDDSGFDFFEKTT